MHVRSKGRVVKPDDGYVLRNIFPAYVQRVNSPHGHSVILGKYGCERDPGVEQLPCGTLTGFLRPIPMNDEEGLIGDPGFSEGFMKPLQSFCCIFLIQLSCDGGNGLVSQGQQIFRGLVSTLKAITGNGRNGHILSFIFDKNDGNSVLDKRLKVEISLIFAGVEDD